MAGMDNTDRRIVYHVDKYWRIDSFTLAKNLGMDQVELNKRLQVLEEKNQLWLRHYCGGTDVTIRTAKEKAKLRRKR